MSRLQLIAGVFAVALGAGCHRPLPGNDSGPGNTVAIKKPASSPKPGGAGGAAVAPGTTVATGERAEATKNPPRASVIYRPGPSPVIKERVSNPYPLSNEADAEEEAIVAAAEVISQRLRELDPPVHYRPSVEEVKNEFLRRSSRSVRPVTPQERTDLERLGIEPNRVYVEYEVSMTAEQLRELRTRQRLIDALQIVPVLYGSLIIGYGFLRLDARTKGNRTRLLAVAAGLLVVGSAVAWFAL